MAQRDTNPFPFSESNKRYHTYDYYLKKTFGFKVAKLSLDAGFSCPNIDGTCGRGGCIYCSNRGSGDFAPAGNLTISEQISTQKSALFVKWKEIKGYIAYFQAHTNTYAPVPVLREKFEEALHQPGIVGLNIATRADCLPEEVLNYLGELAGETVLTVELGLQSSNDETARRINRGHTYAQFLSGVEALRQKNPKISICVHIIFGLPGESDEMMMQTVRDVAKLHPEQIKIHLLHVIRGTVLGERYEKGEYEPLERERYVRLVADALELLPPKTVVCRLTGDGKNEDLLAPLWSLRKKSVLNDLDKLLYERQSYQGKNWKE